MHYVKQFDINGVATKQVACIELHGKPNAATEGYVGVLGIDMDSPTHEVYKCCAVNGSIYTWELLSSGLSMLVTDLVAAGAETVTFPYTGLKKPPLYLVKIGDSILDGEGYVYQVVSIGANSCVATYCGIHIVKFGMSAYGLAVQEGFEGTLEEWLESLSGVYVGSGEMPDWCHVQIDPGGEVVEIPDAANALKGTASGAAVAINDASPIDHEIGVKVRKKNLLPYPYNAYKDNTNGMYTDNGDGTITVNGVFSGTPTCELCKFTLPNGTYTIGGGVGSSHKVSVRLYDVKTGANIAHSLASTITTFTVNEPTEVKCWIYAAANQTYDNLVIYPMIEEGSTATAYAPYIEDVSAVKVLECGKNILDVANAPMAGNWHRNNTKNWNYERTATGLKYNIIADTNASWAQIRYQVCPIDTVRGKTITVSFKRTGKEGSNFAHYSILQAGDDEFTDDFTYKGSGYLNSKSYKDVTSINLVNGYGEMTYTIPTDETRKTLFIVFYIGSEMDVVAGDVIEYSDIQIEINDTATEYEPYIEPTEHAVDATGAVKGIMSNGKAITLYTDTAGAVLDCTYNKDENKVIGSLLERIAALEAAVL